MTIQSGLAPGQSLAWIGQRNPSVILHNEDLLLVRFSLVWGGFAIFLGRRCVRLLGPRFPKRPMDIWKIFDLGKIRLRRLAQKAHVLSCDQSPGHRVAKRLESKIGRSLPQFTPSFTKEGPDSGPGTLSFTPNSSFFSVFSGGSSSSRGRGGWGPWNAISVVDTPIFRDIENLDYLYRLVSDLREKSCSAKP